MTVDVAVVGAGPAGLATAGCLQRAGYQVVLYSKVERGPGVAITVWPNGVRALKNLGCEMPWDELAYPIDHMQMSKADGTRLFRSESGWLRNRFGSPGFTILRQQLIESLDRYASGVIRKGELLNISQDETIDCQSDDGHLSVRHLIGADGIHSPTRDFIQPAYRLTEHRMIVVRGVSRGSFPLRVADVAFGLGIQGGLFTMQDSAYWFVAADQRRFPNVEPSEIAKQVAEQLHADMRSAIDSTPQSQMVTTRVEDGPLAFGTETIALVGDAAHPMAPTLGQGAGHGFEDAAALLEATERFGLGPEAFRYYERVRSKRVRSALFAARAAARQGVSANPLASFLRDSLMPKVPARVVQRQMAKSFTFPAS